MFEFLVGLMIRSFWIGLFGGAAVLFTLRLIAALQAKKDWKSTLSILFIPCSIGYFRAFTNVNLLKKIYFGLATMFFVFTLLGSFIVLYTFFG